LAATNHDDVETLSLDRRITGRNARQLYRRIALLDQLGFVEGHVFSRSQ
jgi:hypothetical protein